MNKKKKVISNTEPLPVDQIKYIIQRFELNDSITPTFYIVGFKLQCEINQREVYVETMVNYAECINKSDNEIAALAYNQLKSKIDEASVELLKKKYIIGSEFIPSK